MKAEISVTREDVIASSGKVEAFCLLNGYDQVYFSKKRYRNLYNGRVEMLKFWFNHSKSVVVSVLKEYWCISVALILTLIICVLHFTGLSVLSSETFLNPILTLIAFVFFLFGLGSFCLDYFNGILDTPVLDYDLSDIRRISYLKKFGINYKGNLKSQTGAILDFLHWGKLSLGEESYVFKENYENFLMLDKAMNSKLYNLAVRDILNVQCRHIHKLFSGRSLKGDAAKQVMLDINENHRRINEECEKEIFKKRELLKGKEAALLMNNEQRLMNIVAKKL